MPDSGERPKLMIEEALTKYPRACEALLGRVVFALTKKAVFQTDWGDVGKQTACDGLCLAALNWLAGKELKTTAIMQAGAGIREWYHWPDDSLRWLLEEVQAHLGAEE